LGILDNWTRCIKVITIKPKIYNHLLGNIHHSNRLCIMYVCKFYSKKIYKMLTRYCGLIQCYDSEKTHCHSLSCMYSKQCTSGCPCTVHLQSAHLGMMHHLLVVLSTRASTVPAKSIPSQQGMVTGSAASLHNPNSGRLATLSS